MTRIRHRRWFGVMSVMLALALLASRGATSDVGAQDLASSTAAIQTSISGRVVDALTSAGVPDATVEVQWNSRTFRATTDGAGHFNLQGIPSGTVQLSARATGYLRRSLAQTRPESQAVTVVVTGAKTPTFVEIRLFRLASLGGRVVDDSGEPVVGVAVVAVRSAVRGGPPSPRTPAGRTDDRGRYMLSGLEPGSWIIGLPFVTVSDSPGSGGARLVNGPARSTLTIGNVQVRTTVSAFGSPAAIGVRGGELLVRRTMFFRQTSTPAVADFVTVEPGATRDDIDFVVTQSTSRTVGGSLAAPEAPGVSAMIQLRQADGVDPLLDAAFNVAVTNAVTPGRFSLAGIPPGRYVLHVNAVPRAGVGAVRDTVAQAGLQTLFARVPVDVGDHDVTNLVVTLRPGLRVSGRIVWDTDRPRLPGPLTVRMTDESPTLSALRQSQSAASVSENGTFELPALLPGLYSFFVPAPSPWRVGSIDLGRGRSGARPIEITDDLSSLVIVMTSRFGSVEASVPSAAPGTTGVTGRVLLFPADQSMWSDAYLDTLRLRDQMVSPGGSVRFADVPVGDYVVAAVHHRAYDPRWRRPATLAALTIRAARVSVGDGQLVPVSVSFQAR